MKKTLSEQIIGEHLVEGKIEKGEEIGLKIDHTLIHDTTGTLAALQFEAIGVPRVKTELSIGFVDHKNIQTDFRDADDHKYLQTFAAKYGLHFSRPGNGICHQVYLERFAEPGKTLLGSDSHTPTAGGMGMIAIGSGGLDVATAMVGEPFYIKMPYVFNVKLRGILPPFVSAKDVVLEVLRRIGVKGGVGKILEYSGTGLKTLSVPERGTITNMGTETGATTSIFPSDEVTREFLFFQGRGDHWISFNAEDDAEYDDVLEIDLNTLEPLIALPHSPGNVKTVKDVEGIPIDQVCIGSCTNSSLRDLLITAALLKDKKIHEAVSLSISPGSKQVLENLLESNNYVHLVKAGARILENSCGPCIGMGQSPPTNAVSLRTFNRNFLGRSGTKSAQIYLVSPETAVASAIYGEITDPRKLGKYPLLNLPTKSVINDNMIIPPHEKQIDTKIIRGPNIKPLPRFEPLSSNLRGEVLLKLGDNVTTDDILPAGSKILPLRSNIPEISKYVFINLDSTFHDKAMKKEGGFIVGGENYGQGSSREHAALAPKYLGVKAIIAKSFARIHQANLVNFGVVPLLFTDQSGYSQISQGDLLEIDLGDLQRSLSLKNITEDNEIPLKHILSEREIQTVKAGGKLAYIKKTQEGLKTNG
jgi:aconitate hydratase